jgi:hypothetical protein
MDRGWQADGDQSISLTGTVNGVKFVQRQNGGATVVPWNGFEQGGTITMQFDPRQSS